MKKYLLLMSLIGLSRLCFAQAGELLPGTAEFFNSGQDPGSFGIKATLTNPSGGNYSSAIRGISNSTNAFGIGVWGAHAGFGIGVLGNSQKGNGVFGSSIDGVALYSESLNSSSAQFGQNNADNNKAVVIINSKGLGRALDITMTNVTNTVTALSSVTNGTGSAGLFKSANTQGKGAALYVTKDIAFAGPYSLDVNTELEIRHPIENSSGMTGLRIMNTGPNFSNWTIYTANNGGNLYLYNNGNVRGNFNGSTGAYTPVSDKRLKTNIKDYTTTLADVMKIEVKSYQRLNSDKTEIGLMAQDAMKYFPEIVYDNTTDKGEQFYTMDYSRIGVIAIKAIQEQQSLIARQQQTILQHEEAIELLKKELIELRNSVRK